jgi:general L-amino acid transport system permease protein
MAVAATTGDRRPPPRQWGLRIRHALGGRAGWRGFAAQIAFIAFVVWLGFEIYSNARANLDAQKIATGFGFLRNSAGFEISQTLVPYSDTDSYAYVFLVGLLNTLLVSVVGIFFATIIGFIVGIGRLSPNWLIAKLATGYVELIRNLPLLFQILFWYLAVLAALPVPRQSYKLFDAMFLSNRGIIVPRPLAEAGFVPFAIAVGIGILAAIALPWFARRRLFERGQVITVWPYVLGALIGLPLLAALIFGKPLSLEIPELKGFNFDGGLRLIPEFAALVFALATYTAAFIAENVRAGIQAVHKGQLEAGASLGLTRGATLKLIVVPQAMRVILPPLTNQYLNLTKNSSLAAGIGYPDLFSLLTGPMLSQTGQAIEVIALAVAVYLVISLVTSFLMNLYDWRLSRRSL